LHLFKPQPANAGTPKPKKQPKTSPSAEQITSVVLPNSQKLAQQNYSKTLRPQFKNEAEKHILTSILHVQTLANAKYAQGDLNLFVGFMGIKSRLDCFFY
jgi:hypothetical protein